MSPDPIPYGAYADHNQFRFQFIIMKWGREREREEERLRIDFQWQIIRHQLLKNAKGHSGHLSDKTKNKDHKNDKCVCVK